MVVLWLYAYILPQFSLLHFQKKWNREKKSALNEQIVIIITSHGFCGLFGVRKHILTCCSEWAVDQFLVNRLCLECRPIGHLELSSEVVKNSCVDCEVCFPFPGMTVRDFLGFPSLQEVECSGGSLRTKVNYLSLTLFKMSDNSVIASLISSENTCNTFVEYSSCAIDSSDRRKSVVRTLVADLEEGGSTTLGCNVTSVLDSGHPRVFSWSVVVRRRSECFCLCPCFCLVCWTLFS